MQAIWSYSETSRSSAGEESYVEFHQAPAENSCISQYDIILRTDYRRMKKLSLTEYRALAEFRYQIRHFLSFSEEAVKSASLNRGQYQLMLAIKGMPDGVRPRIRELAARLQIQHNSAVELVNRLESSGLVRRERAQDDRREVLLVLTAKGERILAELAVHHREQLRNAAPTLVSSLRRLTRVETRSVR